MSSQDQLQDREQQKNSSTETGRLKQRTAYREQLLNWYVALSENLTRDVDYTKEEVLRRAYKEVTEGAARTFGVNRAAIWLYDNPHRSMTCVDRYLAPEDKHETDIEAASDFALEVFRFGVPKYVLAVDDTLTEWSQSTAVGLFLRNVGIRALIQAHIWRNNELIGHVVLSMVGRTRRWTVEEMVVVEGLANLLSRILAAHHGRQTEQALAARENELRQVQKMEAVGQLTGGIAHDFNNLLFVILGNLEVVQSMLKGKTQVARLVARASEAATRGATLTQRLLAFSRKQPLDPKAIDLNALVGGMDDLLRRTLGEQIELKFVRAEGLWKCEADESQLEAVILNLAINARDAMPEGGKLTIEMANAPLDSEYAASRAEVKPGHYGMIAISDTGCGMSPEVKQRIFEPFFTTKEVGQGSGLGLSMVYGFVKQSGGHIAVYTEPGQGTTFKLYLPRSRKAEEIPQPMEAGSEEFSGRGHTVLVVEDDADVRTLVLRLLRDLGYETLQAGTGEEALAVLESSGPVDILLTDAILPGGMNGRAIAEAVKERLPGIKVLYMSGYSESAIVHLDPDALLLQKPFRKQDFIEKLKQVHLAES